LSIPFLKFIHSEDQNEALETLSAAIQLPGKQYTKTRLNSKNNSTFYFSWTLFRLQESDDVFFVVEILQAKQGKESYLKN